MLAMKPKWTPGLRPRKFFQRKNDVEKCLRSKNFILRPAGAGPLSPCSGSACPKHVSLMNPHLCHPQGSHIAWWPDYSINLISPCKNMASKLLEFLFMQMKHYPASQPQPMIYPHLKNAYPLLEVYIPLVLPPIKKAISLKTISGEGHFSHTHAK